MPPDSYMFTGPNSIPLWLAFLILLITGLFLILHERLS